MVKIYNYDDKFLNLGLTCKKIKNFSRFLELNPLLKYVPQVSNNVQHSLTRKKSDLASIGQYASGNGIKFSSKLFWKNYHDHKLK